MKLRHGLSLSFLLVLVVSCRKLEPPQTESEILAPLVSTSLRMEHLVPDSLYRIEPDKSITLVYRQNIYNASMGAFEKLETKTFLQTAKLQKLSLGTQTQSRSVSLGQVALSMGTTGGFIIAQNGNSMPIPPVPGQSYGPLPVDGTAFFESITLDSGYMDVMVNNGFPTGISNVTFEIRNQSDNSLVGTETFDNIPVGAMHTEILDLSGKTVEGQLFGTIINFDIDGSNGQAVPIDTTDKITVTITVRDMVVREATAIFPAQEVISLKDTNSLRGVEDVRLVKTIAKDGFVDLRVVSTVEDSLFFHYIINESDKNGIPYELSETIPPAPANDSVSRNFLLPIEGYTFDLTGAPLYNITNAFYSELTGRIDSTGRLVHLTLDDSIRVYAKLTDIAPSYIEGYLGNNVVPVGPETQVFDAFRKMTDGVLEFKEINLYLSVENKTGIPASIRISELAATNSRSKEFLPIDLSALPSPLPINRAMAPGQSAVQTWTLDESSANLNELVSLLPNQIAYALEVESNPLRNTGDLSQFAYDTAGIRVDLEIEMPLDFSATGLTLRDTVDFDPGSIKAPEAIVSGTMYIVADNGYPIEATVAAYFLSGSGAVLDSLKGNERLEAAEMNAQGRVTQLVQSAVPVPFTKERINQWLRAEKVVFQTRFSTPAESGHVRIYDFYTIDLCLSARFKYLFE